MFDTELETRIPAAYDDDAAPALPEPAPSPTPAPASNNALRRRLLGGLAGVVALGALGAGAWWMAVASRHVSTDNAYVDATSAQVTPLVSGPVKAVFVHDTQSVRQGQVLLVLDDTDARIAVASAEAALAQAQRQVRGQFATNDSLQAQVGARAADEAKAVAGVASARSDMERARIDLDRRTALAASGAVSGEELTIAQNGFATAQASYQAALAAQAQAHASRTAAVGTLDAGSALTSGASVDANPEVLAAQAKLDQARVDLGRTVIRAPIDGVVAKNTVQIGQKVASGASLMTVVPIQQAYVEANFKEAQLRKVQAGQPVELTSDLYGSKVKYHGKVVGFSGGTGAAFALIPAQNATGNWIKVVQRLPVRVALDPRELKAHPLRVGLSMNATIALVS